MTGDRVDLGIGEILRFVGTQLDELEEDLRRIESGILAAAMANPSSRRVMQNLDRSLQVLHDLSRLCVGVSDSVECERLAAHHVSTHLRLDHLRARLICPEMIEVDQPSEPDFFD
ncbi:hypothetical protein [Palleronia marisminoris]|uniref:hypothetical protein n=1 Tax=Palleronia marisminoris TaxID=315423 RepID=UPI000A26C5A4|nr:hypothetical protein [Palleronia marisminoris]